MTAMQELRKDLVESILKINNRLDFLDNVSDPKVKELCTIMVNVTLESIIKSIDSELLEMEKQQIIDALEYGWDNGHIHISILEDVEEQYYNETYGSKGSDECQFEPTTNISSATICKHCGKEKFLHQ